MGDRGNIVVKQFGGCGYVYLYAHWGGHDIPSVLQRALAKRWRWTDEAYLARIIFDEMTAGDHGQETGFGITTYLGDHEYDLLVVDTRTQEVRLIKEPDVGDPDFEHPLDKWSFEEYLALPILEKGWGAFQKSRAATE